VEIRALALADGHDGVSTFALPPFSIHTQTPCLWCAFGDPCCKLSRLATLSGYGICPASHPANSLPCNAQPGGTLLFSNPFLVQLAYQRSDLQHGLAEIFR
jgi:hypothetical protein